MSHYPNTNQSQQSLKKQNSTSPIKYVSIYAFNSSANSNPALPTLFTTRIHTYVHKVLTSYGTICIRTSGAGTTDVISGTVRNNLMT
jgi:hypothetical protein